MTTFPFCPSSMVYSDAFFCKLLLSTPHSPPLLSFHLYRSHHCIYEFLYTYECFVCLSMIFFVALNVTFFFHFDCLVRLKLLYIHLSIQFLCSKAWEYNLKSKCISWMLSLFSLLLTTFVALSFLIGMNRFDDWIRPVMVCLGSIEYTLQFHLFQFFDDNRLVIAFSCWPSSLFNHSQNRR